MVTLHFMPDAAGMVRGKGALDSLALEAGADRVRAAIDSVHPASGRWGGWAAGRAIKEVVLDTEYVEPEGTASFLAAALICSKASDHRLTGRFAFAEAAYASHVLSRMIGRRQAGPLSAGRQAEYFGAVCREVLGVEPGRDADRYMVPVWHYLKFAAGLGKSWKLVNQMVDRGTVLVEKRDFVRLMRDAVAAYIRTRVDAMGGIWKAGRAGGSRGQKRPPPDVEVPPDVVEWCARRAEPPAGGDTPPCVERCRGTMNGGADLPHAGRLLVATFYIHAGLDDAAIREMFTGAPDYDPKVTAKQIGQIRRRGYDVPGCRWVASNGLCPGCGATHPTRYRRPARKDGE